ncbi:MAG: helix-turn-helix domain-containing protein [Planctomycetaceae bacterium]|nr:MAG: helix-turn-helix domain-containing protein [Planctomycetaceae bacterium]
MRRNPTVMLLIDTSRVFGREVFRGVTRYSHLHGPWVFLNTLPFYDESAGNLPRLDTTDIDGLIVMTPNRRIIEQAVRTGLPIVVKGLKGPVPGVPNFISDNIETGQRAAQHLLSLGLRHLAYCGYQGISWSKERAEGFVQRAVDQGIEPRICQRPLSREKCDWPNERRILVEWLKSLPKLGGVMAAKDDRGQRLIEACRTAGIRVPDEVAVIGVDNDEIICEQANPSLSSIVRNCDEAGYSAAELLHRWMAGENVRENNVVIRPTEVVSRQSTDTLAIKDREVAEAVRFIRQAAARPLTVEDVVETIAISRRRLDQKFCQLLGHPIHQEITLSRVERIARLLLETNRSVTQIGYDLGFHGPDHIGRYFRRHKGTSPTDFRHRYGHKA